MAVFWGRILCPYSVAVFWVRILGPYSGGRILGPYSGAVFWVRVLGAVFWVRIFQPSTIEEWRFIGALSLTVNLTGTKMGNLGLKMRLLFCRSSFLNRMLNRTEDSKNVGGGGGAF